MAEAINSKELKSLLKLLRNNGVTEYKTPQLELKLGELPREMSVDVQEEVDPEDPYANFPPGMLTPEQLMFYSAGGKPEDDEANRS